MEYGQKSETPKEQIYSFEDILYCQILSVVNNIYYSELQFIEIKMHPRIEARAHLQQHLQSTDIPF